MRRMAWIVMMAFVGATGCEETEDPRPPFEPLARDGGRAPREPRDETADAGEEPMLADAGAEPALVDAREPPEDPQQSNVPAELVGVWNTGSLDLEFWENYREGYWAGRNATPTREAMILREDGSAKFYRYEFLFNFYEEMIDCEGSVAFHHDGTFTFSPLSGRKRFHDFRNSERTVDRLLTAQELVAAKLAGTRAYTYDPTTTPPTMEIKVPTSAPYNWYKQQ